MTTLSRIDAVIFDMDGVLVDSMRYHAEAWMLVLGKHGLDLIDTDIYKREGMTGISSIKDIFVEKHIRIPDENTFNKIIEEKNKIFKSFTIDRKSVV